VCVCTWGSKYQLSMSCIGEDPGGISGGHTLTCETWYSLLQVTIHAPKEDLPVLTHSIRVVHRNPSANHWVGMITL